MLILVTGGAGFIGSHTSLELLKAGYDLIVIDNFSNSHPEALRRVQKLTGKPIKSYQSDLLEEEELERVFQENQLDAVIHFAGYKAVGESWVEPIKYYRNNISGTVNLLNLMQKYQVKNLVFSSSATVYGEPKQFPISEDSPLEALNPYGRTKLFIEEMLQDISASDEDWSISILRYFNPVGAHESGMIGEDPNGIPNNLMPLITKVAVGEMEELKVYGNNYPTPDGTPIRDYIHVSDLAAGHVSALRRSLQNNGIHTYNLGTGQGYSVLEVIQAFESATGIPIPYNITDPRNGDAAVCYANPAKAKLELGWTAEKDLKMMCRDAWRWQSKNPRVFQDEQEKRSRIIGY